MLAPRTRVLARNNTSPLPVEKLKREAEAHAAEDEAFKSKVEARNELDSIVYLAEKQTTELGDKIPADKKTELEAAVTEAKSVLENQDSDAAALKASKEKITGILQSFAEEMYRQQASEGASGNAASEAPESDDGSTSEPKQAETVDADFEVVDDENGK